MRLSTLHSGTGASITTASKEWCPSFSMPSAPFGAVWMVQSADPAGTEVVIHKMVGTACVRILPPPFHRRDRAHHYSEMDYAEGRKKGVGGLPHELSSPGS